MENRDDRLILVPFERESETLGLLLFTNNSETNAVIATKLSMVIPHQSRANCAYIYCTIPHVCRRK